jgi:aspartyl-tRNA(Asn)/glutamyl-tRNA(Gln) amidotransferase subunit C
MNANEENVKMTSEVVRHVAKLSRLALTDEEIEQAKVDLGSIFAHIDRLKDVDTSGVEPLDHPTGLLNRDRNDEVGNVLTQQQVLENAPAVKDVYISVPKVLGGQS